jgi:acetylornithine/succinyldiaminopimelate/putrescine aminotransferase
MERYKNFIHYQAQTTNSPFNIDVERAEGIYIYDKQGKVYMDMIAGIAVGNVGYNHPKVTEAVIHQVKKHMHVMVYGEYIQDAPLEFAMNLAAHYPKGIETTYFVNSGTEATEAALKLAKRATGRTQIISFHKSYHGNTHGSLSVSGNEQKKYAFRPLLPDVHFIHFNEEEELAQITNKTACVIIEPIQGDAGVRIPSKTFMQKLESQCKKTGALLIVDEIQTGFGRTGKFFGFQHFDITPDIITMGKALGGGLPVGAFAASHDLMNLLTFDPMLGHITTFGGNPVSCAAGKAALEVLIDENLIATCEEKGSYFESLIHRHPQIREIRRIGLMFAIELESFEKVYQVVQTCKENGLIGFWFLSCNNSFRLSPPLTISKEELNKAANIIIEALDKL